MTVAEMLEMTRNVMNAAGSTQWSDTNELEPWLGVAHWAEWADLLNTNNALLMQTVTVTQDANGQFDLSSLNTGSGNTAKYWYRILAVASPSTSAGVLSFYYRESRFQDFPNPQPNTSLPYVWYRFGSKIQILPIAAGQSMSVTVNYRPPRADQLASNSDTVEFPEGYEKIVPWRAASMALLKGGNETQASRDITAQWQAMHDAMLLDLGRQSTWPITARSFDTPDMWGG